MVEVTQVGELVAERVHQARVPQRPTGDGVAQADPDHAVVVTDAVTALDVRAFGFYRSVVQIEAPGDLLGVALEALE